MRYLIAVFDFLFGCHHHGLSRVFTIAGRSYQVCCDCGAEFNYSLDAMSIVPCAVTGFGIAHPVVILKNVQQRVSRHAA